MKKLFLLFFLFAAPLQATTFRKLAENDETLNNNSVTTADFAGAVGTGNLMVVWIWYNSATERVSGVADTRGNPYTNALVPMTGAGTLAGWRQEIWYAKIITGDAPFHVTATFTGAFNAEKAITAHEYFGADTLDVTSAANTLTTGPTANASSGSAMTNSTNELIFGAAIFQGTGTNGTGFAPRSTLKNNATEDKNVTSAGVPYSATFSNTAQDWIAQMATFKEAPPSGRGPKIPAPDLTRHNMKRLDTLCELIVCECSDPVITGIDYPIGPVMPGFPVGLKGCGFGNNPDPNVFRVVLTIQDSNGADYDDSLTTVPGKLRDDFVLATIPDDDITGWGVRDQTVCLRVERVIRGRLRATPCFSIDFRAIRDVELLSGSGSDPTVKLQVGGDYGAGPDNPACCGLGCHWPPYQLDCIYSTAPNETFHCSRTNYTGPCADIYGTEIHEIGPLINDWVFDHFRFDSNRPPCDCVADSHCDSNCGQFSVSDPTPAFSIVEGTASPPWNPHISWWVTQDDTMWYSGKVYIEGPCGVPWRRGGYFGPCR